LLVARSVYLGEKVVSEKEYLSAMMGDMKLLQGQGSVQAGVEGATGV
jgi:hypothetical protein